LTVPDVSSPAIVGVTVPGVERSSAIRRSVARIVPSGASAARNACSTLPRRPLSSITATFSVCMPLASLMMKPV
jgi:hypothetical protein